jgi:DNA-binding NtrC family response regulator
MPKSPRFPTILVVEDEFLIRHDTAEMLRSGGYQVLEAANAEEAIDMLNKHPDVRLVFTDVYMPGSMNGLKLAAFVAARWPGIRLLITSGHINVTEADLPSGARFCVKPCPQEAIRSAVARLLETGHYPE